MLLGTDPFSTTPLGTVEGPDLSALPAFEDLLDNPDLTRHFILDLQVYDPDLATTRQVGYGAGEGFTARTFKPYLVDAVNYETRLYDSIGRGEPAQTQTAGDVSIAFGDGENDSLCGLFLDGRTLRVKMGGDGFTLNQYQNVFVGTAEGASWDLRRFSIALRDASAKIDKPIQPNRYAGTGTLEGGDDLKGHVKPLAWGAFFNAPAVLVDRAELVYQLHDGSMDSITDVFDKAEAFTFDSDVADETALYAWVQVPSHYITCLALGLFRLGSAPNGGLVTADGTGDDSGTGYVDTAADIARRIFQTWGGLTDDELDVASFTDLATDQPARVGIYVVDDVSLPSVVDAVLGSILGWRTFTRTGLIAVGRLEIGTSVADIDEDDCAAPGPRRLRTELPYWRRSLGYRRSFAVQGPDDVSIAALDARKDFVSQEFRRVEWSDSSVQTPHPLASEIEINTLLVDETDAQDEADRQGALFGMDRDAYEIQIHGFQFVLRAGQTVTFAHSRFGLSAGRDFVILAIGENTTSRRTSLTLWG